MNTKSLRPIGALIVGLSLSPAVATAMPSVGALATGLGIAATGQSGASDVQQADELLAKARTALGSNQLELADSYISRAERLNPKYGLFHSGDTPAKARADLNRKLAKLGLKPEAPAKGSVRPAVSLDKSSDKTPQDPFLARHDGANPAASAPATGQRVGGPDISTPVDAPVRGDAPGRLPPVDSSAGDPAPWDAKAAPSYPSTGMPAVGMSALGGNGNPKARSDGLLINARKALAMGDSRRAQTFVDQAKTLGVGYGPLDDSPAKVDALVHKYVDLQSQSGRRDSDSYRHQYAALLMEQSEGLLRWREFDEAERLAGEAKRQPVQYNPVEARPDTLLARIAAERRNGGPAAAAPGRIDLAGTAAPLEVGAAPRAFASPQAKQQAQDLTRQARAALARGDAAAAEQLARRADGLVPDSSFGPQEDRPALVLLEIQKARVRGGAGPLGGGVVAAGGDVLADPAGRHLASQSIYDPANDPTRNVQVGNPEPVPSRASPMPTVGGPAEGGPQALQWFHQGEQALSDGNRDAAIQLFRQAYSVQEQLDPPTRQRLQDHLQMLAAPLPPPPGAGQGLLEGAAARQQVLYKQVSADVSRLQSTAESMKQKDPKKALEVLQQCHAMVENAADLDPQARQQLVRRVDESIQAMQQYIQQNLAQIENDQKNQQVHQEVDAQRKNRLVIGEKLAAMVDQYNKYIEDRRYADARIVASKAAEMDPENPVVVQMVIESKALQREFMNNDIKDKAEDGFVQSMLDVDRAKIPYSGDPLQFGQDAPTWAALTSRRAKLKSDDRQRRLPGDIEIEQKLTTPVSLKFKQAPLGEVLNYLAKVTQINMHIDPQGLQAEGVTVDQPVTIDLSHDIQLKSALNLILKELHLSYVISDEVLNITSEDKRHGQVYTVSYPVADLVIPIPNFGPDGREGINAALKEAYGRLGYNGPANSGFGGNAPLAVAANDSGSKSINPAVAAQMRTLGVPGTGQVQSGQPQPSGFGPGGLKGGSQADFDSLIDLITSTIAPQTWDSAGGAGSIAPFETNLTLVVSQTQEVHEQIADLLTQLRRLQDLQVTIEVRFITLNDNFFEQIGVNFNFNIPSTGSGVTAIGSLHTPSQVVGVDPTVALPQTGTLQNPAPPLTFRQGSYGAAAVPTLTGLTVDSTPTTFGFAILSDIEAFFLIQAFQGDNRSNVLQAPKVTLFNGQQAFVSDTSQRPFVTSVIPVVGDFAAAQQPVITVLSEGTSLTVQAVVSPDRRFVRLTVVPFFSQIGDVQEFQFTGSKTTTSNSATATGAGSTSSASNGDTVTSEGTTVQLPTFNFVTVTTTVSVPDGGTVLLGGIKRLSEARNEHGVPVLSKIPYIDRLFKNVGIGRTTSSLMMMVTPRIIIQEEEETKLLGTTVP